MDAGQNHGIVIDLAVFSDDHILHLQALMLYRNSGIRIEMVDIRNGDVCGDCRIAANGYLVGTGQMQILLDRDTVSDMNCGGVFVAVVTCDSFQARRMPNNDSPANGDIAG